MRRVRLLRRLVLLLRFGGDDDSPALVLPRGPCDDLSEILALTRLGYLAGLASTSRAWEPDDEMSNGAGGLHRAMAESCIRFSAKLSSSGSSCIAEDSGSDNSIEGGGTEEVGSFEEEEDALKRCFTCFRECMVSVWWLRLYSGLLVIVVLNIAFVIVVLLGGKDELLKVKNAE